MEMQPNMTLKLASLFRTNSEIRIMGTSVIRGAMDTFIPALMSCLRHSDITSTRSGPGVNPAANAHKQRQKRTAESETEEDIGRGFTEDYENQGASQQTQAIC